MIRTKLMGIVNVTPDSFFDGGQFFDPECAIAHGLQLVQDGADLLDIGGESSRPGAMPVSEADELARTIPVIRALRHQLSLPLSIDTTKPKVAAAAINAGATLINDITGFRDPAMRDIAASTKADLCLMHMQGSPRTMQQHPEYPEGIIHHLLKWLDQHIELLIHAGVQEKKIILDPGIGFGKTVADNLEILQNLPQLKTLGFPLLFGISRKSFMGKLLHKKPDALLPATLVTSTFLAMNEVDILRVHDVREHRDLIVLLSAMMPRQYKG